MSISAFEFTNYEVEVTLAGQKFTMDCSTDTGDYLKEVSEKMRELAEEYGKGEKTKDDLVTFGKGVIDRILGDGAADKLLSGRTHLISDISDICMYLGEIAAQFQNERKAQTMNRAQRRAQKK